MFKLIAITLLVGLLALPTLTAAAGYPIPHRYLVGADGSCIAPDGTGAPIEIAGASTSYWIEKGNTLVMHCQGALPEWAAIPKEATKLDYGTTGLLCAGRMKENTWLTRSYGALVLPFPGSDPPGWVDITCRFDLGTQP